MGQQLIEVRQTHGNWYLRADFTGWQWEQSQFSPFETFQDINVFVQKRWHGYEVKQVPRFLPLRPACRVKSKDRRTPRS